MPTMLIYAKLAAEYGISEDRVRKIIRSPQLLGVLAQQTAEKCSTFAPNFKTTAPARVRPDPSGLKKIHLPVIIGNTLPTNG